ncbi:sulfatase family protein [Flavilitoribacter nigricans]|uniref:Sulfatase n=1 Tax=Flavilitoribacter nigricans (strain ATCC 23147 / DSM 23189 / NBRC 102662 / NCIMB 1420 / SS-2) TaxID=1122177 RepID=A0A2D0NJU2_FLAN2|nr:sulfatase [Flavilitoribacter nigricans]PHN08469.1 sulfatase [Flavilitoribacter nigricans DSM 23189 = NBRC 102662]
MNYFLRIALFTFYFTAFFGRPQLSAQSERPNMIIFISDDQSSMDVACYGNPDVRTPHMDRLAAEGMRFTSAYAATPMCAPSRSNMFTGLYPFRNGSQMNHFAVHPNTRMLPDYLQELGYRVVIAGKVDVYPQPDFEHIGAYFGKYFPITNRDDPRQVSSQFIKDNFGKDQDQPICLIVATWWPHVPWLKNEMYRPEELTMPDYLVDTEATRQALAAYYESTTAADQLLGNLLEALETTEQQDNTVVMFFSDQGPQFPSAKWTTYRQGLNIPFIVRWPGKTKAGSVSEALISLTDLTPTLIDLAGGQAVDHLDGSSFKEVLLGKRAEHREFAFAETSVEPHYWYNYTPARTVISRDGLHYIRNYRPGVRFITHIDKVERDHFYFDSWENLAERDPEAQRLLHRYSYRPAEELYDLEQDPWEFDNLVSRADYAKSLEAMRDQLDRELERQGETEAMILRGSLPTFFDRSYQVEQGMSASDQSFDRTVWNPDTLYISAYVEGLEQNGFLCDYFGRFQLFARDQAIGISSVDGTDLISEPLSATSGHLLLRLTADGALSLRFNDREILSDQLDQDYTKIKAGYISCGLIRDRKIPAGEPNIFGGKIHDFRVSINTLSRSPRR